MRDSLNFLHILGEVQNNGTRPAKFVRVVITIYDAAGKVVAANFTYAKLETIQPGEKSPYKVIITHDINVDHYKLQIEYREG